MKYIIWGVGNTWKKCESYVNMAEIVCFTDSNKSIWGKNAWDKKILPPNDALKLDFDFVVIMSEAFSAEITDLLIGQYGVSCSKIKDWMSYIIDNCSKSGKNQSSYVEILRILSGYTGEVLDFTNGCVKYNIYSKRVDDFNSLDSLIIDGIRENNVKSFPIYSNIYNKFVQKSKVCNKKKYRFVIVADKLWDIDCSKLTDELDELLEYGKIVVFNRPSVTSELISLLRTKYNVKWKQYFHSAIFMISEKQRNDEIKIYVVTHKKCKMPIDDIYLPIHVGKNKFNIDNMVRDDISENIAEYNSTLNECTAMFWMWKNADCKIIGLNHYRRFFVGSNYGDEINLIDRFRINELLEKYDIILAPKYYTYFQNVKEHLSNDIHNTEVVDIARGILIKKHPDYIDAFDHVFNGYALYRCNLLITRKELFDKYCEFLFSFIIDVNNAIDVTGFDSYSSRAAGFIAERMLTVWLLKQDLNIKELPFIQVELR